MGSWSWTALSSMGESLSECMGCDLPGEGMLRTLWILLNQLEEAHGGGCGYPLGQCLGCMQASLTACLRPGHQHPGNNPRPPCLKAVGLWAVCQQHWNHTMEAKVHRNSGKALHYVESEVESSLQGKVGSLTAPNFHTLGLQDSFYLHNKFGKLGIILQLVGEENVIGVLPSLVGLHSKPLPDPFTSIKIRVEHVLNASCLAGHTPSIYGLMGSSLGHNALCCLKGGEKSELLGHFRTEFLALCDQLVGLCCLVLA